MDQLRRRNLLIKPLYLLADSQLLFWREDGQSLPERIRAELPAEDAKAAYIGASSGDRKEFYDLFVSAMEGMGITQCHMIPVQFGEEDKAFIERADLILLGGGNVEQGWQAFEHNGLRDVISRKRYDGCVLAGVSAGAVQLGMGSLTDAPQPKKLELFRFAPFYVAAHQENEEWWDLRVLLTLAPDGTQGIGIPLGGGAIYWPDGTLEPLRRPLTELIKEGEQVKEHLLMPSSAPVLE
jgi:peptidase E